MGDEQVVAGWVMGLANFWGDASAIEHIFPSIVSGLHISGSIPKKLSLASLVAKYLEYFSTR